MSTTLCLHRGCVPVTLTDLAAAPPPERLGPRHTPLPHDWVVRTLSRQCDARGFQITRTQLGLNQAGTRMFGVLDFKSPDTGIGWGLGFRNSHDQRFSLWMGVSERVFVCDNLVALAANTASRVHTGNFSQIADDILARLNRLLDNYPALQENLLAHTRVMRETPLTDSQANDLLVRSVDARIIPARRMWDVRREYLHPTFPEFHQRNLWSLYNATTTVLGRDRGFDPAAATAGGRMRSFLLTASN